MDQKWKRGWAFLLAAVMCFSLLSVGAVALEEEENWSHHTTQPELGTGTEADPYQIAIAEELAWFAALVNKYGGNPAACAVLVDDIDLAGLGWVGIGYYEDSTFNSTYTGTFDGQNHTIYGLTINETTYLDQKDRGLFGRVGTDGVVRNVVISDSSIRANSVAGAVCGRLDGLIENCRTASSVKVYAHNGWVGGICGTSGGTIKDCVNFASVSNYLANTNGQPYIAGGIVGQSIGSIEGCKNMGTVQSCGPAGGIAGEARSSISECYNFAEVSGKLGAYGICGSTSSVGSYYNVIEDCGNYGELIAEEGSAAGIAQIANGVRRCFNEGDITAGFSAAGIVMYIGRDDNKIEEMFISDCFNSGNITLNDVAVSDETEEKPYHVAGIVLDDYGYAQDYMNVTNCYNTGTLTGAHYSIVGGIAAEFVGYMLRCYNTGTVQYAQGAVVDQHCGGIAGTVEPEFDLNEDVDIEDIYAQYSFLDQNVYLRGAAAGAVSGEDLVNHTYYPDPEPGPSFPRPPRMTSADSSAEGLTSTMLALEGYTADSGNQNDGYPVLKNCPPVDPYTLMPEDPDAIPSEMGEPTITGESLYVGSRDVNLLHYETYRGPGGAFRFDRASGVLTLSDADVDFLEATMNTNLTVEISGSSWIEDISFDSLSAANPSVLTLKGSADDGLGSYGDLYVNGNLVIDGLAFGHSTDSAVNLQVEGNLSVLNGAFVECWNYGSDNGEEGGGDEGEVCALAEEGGGEEESGTTAGADYGALSVWKLTVQNSTLMSNGTYVYARNPQDHTEILMENSEVSVGEIRCNPAAGYIGTLAVYGGVLTADRMYCGDSSAAVATTSQLLIDGCTATVGELYTENYFDKAPEIAIRNCDFISPKTGLAAVEEHSQQDIAGILFSQRLVGDNGEAVQTEPKDHYAFTYDHSKPPFENLRTESENSSNIIMAYTAMAKLAYSTHPKSYFGKTVDNYVSDGRHMEYLEHQDKIWTYSDVTYETFYRDLIGDFGIVKTLNNSDNGFYGVCFQDPEDGTYIISYRGSQGAKLEALAGLFGGENNNDWTTDIAFAVQNTLSSQFDDALEFYYDIAELAREQGEHVMLTGHSLGGALAGYVSLVTGAPAITIDGAVGHIVDTSFWQEGWRIERFHGVGKGINLVNVTDTVGVSVVGDLIQAVHKGVYPMLTYDPVSYLEDTSGYIDLANTHQQVSYMEYRNGLFQLAEQTAAYCRDTRWSNDICELGIGQYSGIAGIFPIGRVQLGTVQPDEIKAPSVPVVDNLPNTQFGGDSEDVLVGYAAGDTLCGGAGRNILEGQGGADVYLVDAGSHAIIRDPSGYDEIQLRGVGDITIDDLSILRTQDTVVVTHEESNTVVEVSAKRHQRDDISLWSPQDVICESLMDYLKTEGRQSRSVYRLAAVSEEPAVNDATRMFTLEGTGSISVYDAEDVLLGTYSNLTEGSNAYYTEFGYFYCDNSKEAGRQITAYLFGAADHVVPVAQEAIALGLFDYVEDNCYLESGVVAQIPEGTEDVQVQLRDSGDSEEGIYIGDEPAQVEHYNPWLLIEFEEDHVEIPVGGTAQLIATVDTPEATLPVRTWYSSDESVVTVDDSGRITGVKEGTANVFLVAGENYDWCTVTVTAAEEQADYGLYGSVQGDGKVCLQMVNNTDEAVDCLLYMAAYDGEGWMCGIACEEYCLGAGSSQILTEQPDAKENVHTVNYFLLSKDYTPLAACYPLALRS